MEGEEKLAPKGEILKKCAFYLVQKKRYCSQSSLKGKDFCGVHSDDGTKARIHCPVDPSHTIFVKDERLHVLKCNKTKDLKMMKLLPYYSVNVNKGSISSEDKIHVDILRAYIGMEKEEKKEEEEEEAEEELMQVNKEEELMQVNKEEELMQVNKEEEDGEKKGKDKGLIDRLRDRHGGYISLLFHDSSPVNLRNTVLRLIDMIPIAEASFKNDLSVHCDFVAPNISKHIDASRNAGATVKGNLRQSIQEASIVSQMFVNGLLEKSETTFIDLGAGKANLSLALHQSVPHAKLLLVEKSGGSGSRGAADTSFRREDFTSFSRLKIDLADFDLANLIKSHPLKGGVVGMGKHACGSATDLSLRCLELASKHLKDNNLLEPPHQKFIEGVCIATCCHHRCTWEDYVGKAFFTDILGATAVEFEVLRLISSWALMGGREKEVSPDFPRLTKETCFDSIHENCEEWEHFSRKNRIDIGRAAKRVIDAGRIHFLENTLRLRARQVFYCDQNISPENCLILGHNS